MARASYGPEAKKRSRRLLEVLLAYANDALDCSDEAGLDALRPQIQTRWLSENRLVVRTKVRFLQTLTSLAAGEGQLNAEQIKEALKRFTDFLEILEDNRPSRSGSETWHFTLNLWCDRQDITANLQKFDIHWESRRPEKSKQVTREEEKGESPSPLRPAPCSPAFSPDWKQLCRDALTAQNHQRLTTNPLTSADGVSFELNQVYVPLGLVERKQRLRQGGDVTPQDGSRLYEPEDSEMTQTFNPDEFIQQLLGVQDNQRIAILGEPGAGKTTLLQKIAAWIVDNTKDLPVWVSLADLQGKTLEQYLIQDWLPTAFRKLRVSEEVEEAFCEQFNQGRVWLLLDAVDEMALDSSQALTKIASFLTGWVADAKIILTCRLNVWDGGKNALQAFKVYRNLNFSYGTEFSFGSKSASNQVGEFIQHWFQDNPACGESLQAELNQPERRRLKDAVKNPLRLALLCRTWGLAQGRLATTKAMLYEQFVESIYEWKQDRFPTTSTQRQQLNRALGELALLAISQEKTKFRLRHRFVSQVLGASDDGLFQLALQLGWLNQVGISETQGEKVYAFYHPTFQEYFAAQAVTDWHFFLNHTLNLNNSPTLQEAAIASTSPSYRIFAPQWREVILLWLGRDDIPQTHKEEFIQALIEFNDNCGGYYGYQAYFVAAQGIAEFADCQKADEIVQQLVTWRFGYGDFQDEKPWRYPAPIVECARVALLKTDRPKAIAALENYISSSQNDFVIWNAAYSLGKIFDPGNKIAIAKLEALVKTMRYDTVRWQVAYSLARVDAGNQIAIAALVEIIATSKNESTRRKAAYSLGKIDSQNSIAISTLKEIAASAIDSSQSRQALENLAMLQGDELPKSVTVSPTSTFHQHRRNKRKQKSATSNYFSINSKISELIRGIAASEDEDTQRRRAYKLAQLNPGNPIAFTTLLQLMESTASISLHKRAADNLKEIVLNEQLPQIIAALKNSNCYQVLDDEWERYRNSFKLLWHCAENMDYLEFYRIWHL
ncbi:MULTISPECIES: HEAT repeat domain-containing protein [unclassified Tolypothrix]|uniref:HEAT repeat domain-containing protein n=1 Tax=unclassified Tolypothrix TaxID=2649714 RepID=UPI0005EABA9D|nr:MULTISPECIES: HEAT repeat domain-containing protein [unclassified Tolypothrix]EKF05447.1 NTP-binding protein [Tolypothrix sp. PCC 7601]MBE9081629.1 HEAT repeat domain-containing protein [Tolypothrix sp. LEGE 11397]UYD30157.1 HEAT repeat domain-containing protein [Tolypothrix sp. PCC 7712]UYD32230.1 HEAT repeat domain-containing protein [Tolypothrix sp. PCC 7601]